MTFMPFAEKKCWGKAWHVFASTQAAVSCLTVEKGWKCSRHKHEDRVNLFVVQSGSILIEEWPDGLAKGRKTLTLEAGDSHFVEERIWHRFCIIESGAVVEVYWSENGKDVRMDDIQRIDQGGKWDPKRYEVEKRQGCKGCGDNGVPGMVCPWLEIE